ncbi:MAG TPA: hypothetical protein VF057_12135, partial [Thermoanaerobaculia bacterium]
MKSAMLILALSLAVPAVAHDHPTATAHVSEITALPANDDLLVTAAGVRRDAALDVLVFEMSVKGTAGGTRPSPRGQLDGAPVLGYVFPTTLASKDVGFGATEGIVALAVTSHPDFDDSPLWDENGDGRYDNDGLTWHTHWVVLTKDERAAAGLSVKQFRKADGVVLPPTAPDMPMYMDSPGFNVVAAGRDLRVVIPLGRVNRRTDFRFDAVTAYMQVSTDPARPMLGVY